MVDALKTIRYETKTERAGESCAVDICRPKAEVSVNQAVSEWLLQ